MIVSHVLSAIFVREAQKANLGADDDTLLDAEIKAHFDARAIGGATLLGSVLLLWLPWLLFKLIVSE